MAGTIITTERNTWNIDTAHSNILGKGAYGIVYKARSEDSSLVAAKIIDTTRHRGIAQQDFNKLLELNHKNVVKVYDFHQEQSNMYIFMEFCQLGDLNSFFCKENPGFGTQLSVMRQIARGIEYLHSKDFVHRDVKPENILVYNSSPVIKLTDFDISKFLDPDVETSAMSSNVGTQMFKAPEFFKRTKQGVLCYHRNVDVFAAGLTYLAMLQYKEGSHRLRPQIETPRFDSELFEPIGRLLAERIKLKKGTLNVLQTEEVNRAAGPEDIQILGVRRLIVKMTRASPGDRLNAAQVLEYIERIDQEPHLVLEHLRQLHSGDTQQVEYSRLDGATAGPSSEQRAPATASASYQGLPTDLPKTEGRELTDSMILRLSQHITSASQIRELAVLGLGMSSQQEDVYIANKTGDSTRALYEILMSFRMRQENRQEAYSKLCEALERVKMGYYIRYLH